MAKNKDGDNLRDCVRVAKFEIDSVDGGEWKAVLTRWFETETLTRQAANVLYETWLVWHVANGSRQKLIAWLDARKANGIKEAGKCPVLCIPSELNKVIYAELISQFPTLHNRVLGLLQNLISSTLKTKKASRGSLPGWSAILLHNEAMPSFTKSYPIPFDIRNSKLVRDGDRRIVELSTWRVPRKGKAATSITDRLVLRSNTKGSRMAVLLFDKIHSGEWCFKGSTLSYDHGRKKWFVNLCHQRPTKTTALNPDRVAYLIPGRRIAFYVRERGERQVWLQGRGTHISGMRERVWQDRAAKSSNYKHASNRRGRGFASANKWRDRAGRIWRHFVRTVNHQVSIKAAEWCVANGIGTLIYLQPSGAVSQNRFVSGDYKNSTWEFHALKSLLEYKCQERGIGLRVVKCGSDDPQSDRLLKSA